MKRNGTERKRNENGNFFLTPTVYVKCEKVSECTVEDKKNVSV